MTQWHSSRASSSALVNGLGVESAAGRWLQHLLSRSRWEADEVRDDLHAYVAEHLGADNGVLIIDDTGFVKKDTASAVVRRHHSGTAGRTENCWIGVFPACATTRGCTLVDREFYVRFRRIDGHQGPHSPLP